MKRTRPALLAAAATLAGCGSVVTPFVTVPKAAGPGVTDPGPRVAVCYNSLKTAPEQVQQVAQAECLNGGTAELVWTDYILDFCPLATPGRATFVCRPKK